MSKFEEPTLWPEENMLRFTVDDLNKFLIWTYQLGASDVFIEADEPLAIKLHKKVVYVGRRPIKATEVDMLIKDIYKPSGRTEVVTGIPAGFKHTFLDKNDKDYRYRVQASGVEMARGVDATVRLTFRTIEGVPPTVEELKVEQELLDAMNSNAGLIIVAGSTNSGKTTLLSSVVGYISTREAKNIITYEDPVEYNLKKIPNRKSIIDQSEVPGRIKSYTHALRDALRRSPDIIWIGEASSNETMVGCCKFAITGHCVFTTVHAINVSSTIPRIVGDFPREEQDSALNKIIDAIRLIVFQRLVPAKNGGLTPIKEWKKFNQADRRRIKSEIKKGNDISLIIEEMVREDGVHMVSYAIESFSKGLITIEMLYDITSEYGDKDDALKALDALELMHQQEKVLNDDYLTYKELLTLCAT